MSQVEELCLWPLISLQRAGGRLSTSQSIVDVVIVKDFNKFPE